MFCEECGAKLKDSLCPNCNRPRNTSSKPENSTTVLSKKNIFLSIGAVLLVLFVIAVLAALSIGAYYFLYLNQSSEPSNENLDNSNLKENINPTSCPSNCYSSGDLPNVCIDYECSADTNYECRETKLNIWFGDERLANLPNGGLAECMGYICKNGELISELKSNCCGNNKCEPGESEICFSDCPYLTISNIEIENYPDLTFNRYDPSSVQKIAENRFIISISKLYNNNAPLIYSAPFKFTISEHMEHVSDIYSPPKITAPIFVCKESNGAVVVSGVERNNGFGYSSRNTNGVDVIYQVPGVNPYTFDARINPNSQKVLLFLYPPFNRSASLKLDCEIGLESEQPYQRLVTNVTFDFEP